MVLPILLGIFSFSFFFLNYPLASILQVCSYFSVMKDDG